MKFSIPWSVKGIRPEARETAKEAARRSGMSLGEWLNSVILHQAAEDGVQAPPLAYDDDDSGDDHASVHQRLDDLTRRIENFTRTGPAAYAPKRSRNEPDQIADLIARLDRRLDQFVNNSRPMPPPAMMPPAMPLPPSLDRAVAEINARQRALNGEPATARQLPAAAAAAPAPVFAPMPAQDLSGLEDHLRKITDQIETLRKPGVEEAINALRGELGEIGRALTDAMPKRAIDTIEKQITGLSQRIAEGRQAGVDGGALSGIEHGLAEVRDALRGLTPAENLVGFNEAVAELAHKIDLIVAQKDPATIEQLEHAITTLRDMSGRIASNDAVGELATQVQVLSVKVDHIAMAAGAGKALNNLEQRIGALSDALAERAQNGGAVPPRLEALVQSLSDKIEMIQQSRGDNVVVGHLEDHIVKLVERLDASDSRLGHLEAIERGLADLLINIEEMRTHKDSGALRADNSPGVDSLKHQIALTQDALEAVNGTLGHVVDRLVSIETDIRGEGRSRGAADSDTGELKRPVGKVAVRMVSDAPPQAAAATPPPTPATAAPQAAPPVPAPKRLPAAGQLPIDPDLPPDQPLEPGSGPPRFNANPAARIAASEAALGPARPAAGAPVGKSGFIAAARRAAQAAVEVPSVRVAPGEFIEVEEIEPPSLRDKVMKRVKQLFIAASIVAVVIGSIQIAGNFFDFGSSEPPTAKTAKAPAADHVKSDTAAPNAKPEAPASVAATPFGPPELPSLVPVAPPIGSTVLTPTPPQDLNPSAQGLPPLLNPPAMNTPVLNMPALEAKGDITGSIARPGTAGRPTRAAASTQPDAQNTDRLPIAIGGQRLRSAAIAGDGAAAYEVAVRFAEGRGVPVNLEEAVRWYERAAGKGLAPAQFRYASLLEKGQGIKKDLGAARRLYLAAAAKGNAKAMHNLAVLYAEGIDGKPEYAASAQWFGKAAQRGIADSQYNLGVLCARGLGIEKNLADSYKWFALAAAQGDREAAKKRDELAAHLDAKTLEAAQLAVKSFVPEPQPHDATAVPEPPGGWDHAGNTPVKPRPGGALSSAQSKLKTGE